MVPRTKTSDVNIQSEVATSKGTMRVGLDRETEGFKLCEIGNKKNKEGV